MQNKEIRVDLNEIAMIWNEVKYEKKSDIEKKKRDRYFTNNTDKIIAHFKS